MHVCVKEEKRREREREEINQTSRCVCQAGRGREEVWQVSMVMPF